MSAIGFPSHNQVSIIGRIAQEPTFGGEGRVRTVTLGVETDDEGGARIHRITIQDEFLAKAMHERLVLGAVVHVLGELDYDADGCHVAITQRRGSDVNVLATGNPPKAARPAPTAAPQVARQPVQQPPRPVPAATAQPSPAVADAAHEAVHEESGADVQEEAGSSAEETPPAAPPAHSPQPTVNPAAPARRPLPPPTPAFSMPRPVPPATPRPAATTPSAAGGSVLGGLKPSSGAAHSPDDAFPGDMPSKLPNGLGSPRPVPTRAVGAPGGRVPTGPDSFDDDIPF